MSRADDVDAAVLDFLSRCLRDIESGGLKPLGDYVARYPGSEDRIREEYARLGATGGGATPSEAFRIGPYRVERELGRGGQATVYLAHDDRIGRRVALKVLSGTLDPSGPQAARFRREATAAASIDSPGLCRVLDVGMEAGRPFLAMQLVEGDTLAERLRRRPRPSSRRRMREVVGLVEQVARALDTAHEVGVVHRDVKPGNIMIGRDERPVLVDFGLARPARAAEITVSGEIVGTPSYMSPEQLAGQPIDVDRRTDVYSLGVVLFELLTHELPFTAPTCEALFRAVLEGPAPSVRRINPAVPSELETIVAVALATERHRRYDTARALADDLHAWRTGGVVSVKPPRWPRRALEWVRRHPGRSAAAVAVVALSTAGGFLGAKWTELAAAQRQLMSIRADDARRARVDADLHTAYTRLESLDFDGAAGLFQTIVAEDPGHDMARAGLCLVLLKTGELDQALALSRHDTRFDPLHLLALTALGRLDDAEALRRDLDGRVPSDGFEWFVRGLSERGTLWLENEHAKPVTALKSFQRAIEFPDSTSPVYYRMCANCAVDCCDREAALRLLRIFDSTWPNDERVALTVATIAILVDPSRAEAAFLQLIESAPDDGEARYRYGTCLMDHARYDEAIPQLRRGLAIRPTKYGYNNLADCLRLSKRPDASLAVVAEALRIDPAFVAAAGTRANALIDLGRPGEAADFLKGFAERYGLRDAGVLGVAGHACLSAGRPTDAVRYYEKALTIDPELGPARSALHAMLTWNEFDLDLDRAWPRAGLRALAATSRDRRKSMSTLNAHAAKQMRSKDVGEVSRGVILSTLLAEERLEASPEESLETLERAAAALRRWREELEPQLEKVVEFWTAAPSLARLREVDGLPPALQERARKLWSSVAALRAAGAR